MKDLSLKQMLSDSTNQYAQVVQGIDIKQEDRERDMLLFIVDQVCKSNIEKLVDWIDTHNDGTGLVLAINEVLINILDGIEKCKKRIQ